MSFSISAPREQTLQRTAQAATTVGPYVIILWNDEVNTFDWVIECLVKICGHTTEQAEQCAYFVHYKGKYAVKHGQYADLQPKAEALQDRGLSVTIEEKA